MSEQKSDAYENARRAFDGLKMDERATFLVESVVAMLTEGVGEAGRVVSDVIDEMADNLDKRWKEHCEEDSAADGPAAEDAPKAKTSAKSSARSKTAGSRRARGTGAKKPSGGKEGGS